MRIAVMDLGTNTFHLLIVEVQDAGIKTLYKTKAAVRLGENGIASGFISSKPFQRGRQTIKRFKKTIDRYHPERVIAIGTAAIREASNKKDFIQAVLLSTGIQIQIIDGDKEATLIYEGVNEATNLGNQKTLIMDIGGGSVEFIIADNKRVFWKQSFKLGAARLLDLFKPYDPITADQLKKIKTFLNKELKPLVGACKKFPPVSLTGSSGSFDTFSEMIAYKFYSPGILRNKTYWQFSLPDYHALHHDLLYSTTAERKQMKGLIAMRVDMIVIASIMLTFVLEKIKLKQMYLSTYALKEGVLRRIINQQSI